METLALCIPAYNAAAYLPRLLASARSQEILFDEILVYNDSSTDNTAEVAEKYGAKVINGKVNKGCSFGKNILAEHTKCNWIHFHDADDDILPNFTTAVHKWLSNYSNHYDVLLLNFKYEDANTGEALGTGNHNTEELHADPLKYAINNKIVNFGVYNKNAFLKAGGFDVRPEVLYNEDNAFHQRLAKNGLRFDYLPEITCINYRYGVSMSASNELKCALANYHVLADVSATHGSLYPFEIARQLWFCIHRLAAGEDWTYVKKALAISNALGFKSIPGNNSLFDLAVKIYPFGAIWLREKSIRLFKPHLRN